MRRMRQANTPKWLQNLFGVQGTTESEYDEMEGEEGIYRKQVVVVYRGVDELSDQDLAEELVAVGEEFLDAGSGRWIEDFSVAVVGERFIVSYFVNGLEPLDDVEDSDVIDFANDLDGLDVPGNESFMKSHGIILESVGADADGENDAFPPPATENVSAPIEGLTNPSPIDTLQAEDLTDTQMEGYDETFTAGQDAVGHGEVDGETTAAQAEGDVERLDAAGTSEVVEGSGGTASDRAV